MLKIDVKPSRSLIGLIAAAHGAAAAAAAVAVLPLWVKVPLIASICANCGVCLHGLVRRSAGNSIISLELGCDGAVSIQTEDGTWQDGRILGTSFISRWLVVLNVRLIERGMVRHVILLPDSVKTADFRRLRILLRWGMAVRAI